MSSLALGSWELWKELLQYWRDIGKTRSDWPGWYSRILPGTFWGPMAGKDVCKSAVCCQKGVTLWVYQKGWRLLPVFSPLSPRPLKTQVPSATCSDCHQPFPWAQWRGDRRQVAELGGYTHGSKEMGQGLVSGSVNKWCGSARTRASLWPWMSSLQSKPAQQLFPYCLL